MPPPGGSGVAAAQLPIRVLEEPLDHKYKLGNTIGVGSYGKAMLAVRRVDDENVVIKQIPLKGVDLPAMQEALKEAQLLAQFDHVNIIHYYESVLEDQCLNIVMEYASEGDLAAVISQRAQEKKFFPEEDIMMWFVQIVLALFHVHSKNILHRDLKSQNVFISTGNILKLGDFGIARVLTSDTELANTVVGTPYYLSPELCEDKPYNRKSDVWALGCILYELCTLRRAFTGQSLPALVVQILRGKYPPVPTRYSSALRSLVESMLQVNPKDRPSADAILRSSFVKRHVERYAQHVMQLSPVSAPELVPGCLVTPSSETRSRVTSSPARPPVAPVAARAAAGAHKPSRAGSASKVAAAEPGRPQSSDADKGSDAEPGSRGVGTPPGAGSAAKPGAEAAGKQAAGPAGRGLAGSGWVRQQEAALNELQGALMLQGQGHNRRGRCSPAGAKSVPDSSADQSQGDGSAKDVPQEVAEAAREAIEVGKQGLGDAGGDMHQQVGPEPGPRMQGSRAGGSISGAAGLAGAGASKARMGDARQAARAAELEAARLAVVQERARKAQAAAKRSHESEKAVKQRVVERQKEQERVQAEVKAKETEKAARAADLAALLRNKQESKQQVQEQLAAHLAAHQQQVKAAKPRVSRAELAALGAKFAAKHLSSRAVASPDVAAASPLVVVMDPASASPASGRKCLPAGAGGSAQPAKAGALPSKAAPVQSPSAPKDMQAEPPWRAARKAGGPTSKSPAAGGVFPDVQIFTPYGGCEVATPPPAQPPPRSRPASRDTAARAASSPATPPVAQQCDDAGGAALGSSELLGLLSELAEVLAGSSSGEEDEEEEGPSESTRRPGSGQAGAAAAGWQAGKAEGKAKHHLLQLPPEREEKQGMRPSNSQHQRVEQLRLSLEKELGQAAFVAAYNHLKQMQQGDDANVVVVDTQQQEQLKRLLGGKLHLAWQLHRLLKWEENIFR